MPDAPTGDRPPRALLVAAVLAGVEGLVLAGLGVAGLVDRVPSNVEVGASVAVFFGAYGVLLLTCAWSLLQRAGWARGPVLITQLIVLGIAYNARANAPVALGLAAVGVVAIVAMLHPSTIAALLGEREDGD